MPYDPGITYHGDTYAYQGIQALGTGLREAFDKYQQEQQKQQQLAADVQGADLIVGHAAQTGLIPQADLLKYQTADAKGKLAISDALAKNIATDSILQQRTQAAQMQTAQIGNYNADAAYHNAQASQLNNPAPGFAPSQQDIATAAASGKNYVRGAKGYELVDMPPGNAGKPIIHPLTGQPIGIYDSNGKPSYYPADSQAPSNEPSKVDPLPDPVTGKAVPGKGIVRKTGAVVDTSSGTPVLQTDPTGTFFFDKKGNPHPIPTGTVLAQKIGVGTPANPEPSLLQRIFGGMSGAAPGPTPPLSAAANPANTGPVVAAAQQPVAQGAFAPVKGMTIRQNGVVYEFDGQQWNPK